MKDVLPQGHFSIQPLRIDISEGMRTFTPGSIWTRRERNY